MTRNTPSADRSASARNVTAMRLVEVPSGHLVKHIVLAHEDMTDVPLAVEGFEFLRHDRERRVPRDHRPATKVELVDALTGDVLAAGYGPIELDLADSGIRARSARHYVNNPKCESCIGDVHPDQWHAWLSQTSADAVEEVTGNKLCHQRCGCPCAGDWYTIRVGQPVK